jgi:hypothetical protein
MKKCIFLAATKDNILLPPKMKNSFVNVLTDFLTIIKYRKNDINKILSEYAEMIRAVQLDFIRQTTQDTFMGIR